MPLMCMYLVKAGRPADGTQENTVAAAVMRTS
jgi:hypothetical protein